MGVPLVQIIFGGIVVGFVLLNYIQPLVDLNTDISTKESKKGQLEGWIERLKLDSTNIALQQLAKSLDTEKEQLALLNDSLKQETDDLEKKNKAAVENLAMVEKRISALNAQEQELLATIESEKVRVIITAAFGGFLDSETYANVLEKYQMIKAKNYYDERLNPEGQGIDNQFQPQLGDSVIFDAATALYWQQSGSVSTNYVSTHVYIKKINADTYGGYNDWRLPTLEEAMSLMEPQKQNNGPYIEPIFDKNQRWIWTADKYSASSAWVVYFDFGGCYGIHVVSSSYVRAVR